MNLETLSALAEKNISPSDPLKSFKAHNLEQFKKRNFKEIVKDSYKFTSLESFFRDLKSSETKTEHAKVLNDEVSFPTLTFLNGVLTDQEKLPEGVTIREIKEENLEELLKETNPLSGLHHALAGNGVILHIAKSTETSTPVRILNLISEGTLSSPTNLIIAEKFSKITVIEETRSEGAEANIGETFIKAFEGAKVEHISLHQGSADGLNHVSTFADIAQDASVRSLIFHVSGKMNRTNLAMNLNAQGANAESYALFLANSSEHSDICTEINHRHADTTSDQIAKGILDGEAKGVFTGKIHIFPNAQRVASGQLNKNLLLSKKAHAHSQPQLEIFADDVKCSHGSTTGQLSDEEVFYFQSRGIPAERARNLLALGFGLEIVEKIENKEAKSFIRSVIMDGLAGKFSLRRVI